MVPVSLVIATFFVILSLYVARKAVEWLLQGFKLGTIPKVSNDSLVIGNGELASSSHSLHTLNLRYAKQYGGIVRTRVLHTRVSHLTCS